MAGRSRRQVCRASSGATEIFYFLIFFFLFFSPKSSWPAGHELEDTAYVRTQKYPRTGKKGKRRKKERKEGRIGAVC